MLSQLSENVKMFLCTWDMGHLILKRLLAKEYFTCRSYPLAYSP